MRVQALALLAAAAGAAADVFQPSQIHLSFTGKPGQLGVDFVTDSTVGCAGVGVAYGSTPAAMDTFVEATSCYAFDGVGNQVQVLLDGLTPNATLYYTCGSRVAKDWAWSTVYSFTVPDVQQTTSPHVVAVYADFGLYNAESLPKLTKEALEGRFDFVIHAGDFAYDMDANGGATGNDFMLSIEPIAATMPYMPSPGNHEVGLNFTHFKNRFASVTNFTAANSGSWSNLFYSFDVGLVHYVSIDTEVFDEFQGQALPDNMLAWLQADLAKANANRDRVPWIIGYGHKASYMAGNSSLWEKIFYEQGVDLFFCGHVHSYTRWLPYYPITQQYDTNCTGNGAHPNLYQDPNAMVTIVSGAPGNQEINADSHCEVMAGNSQMTHCGNYGYGYITVFNETHAHWRFETSVPVNGTSMPDYADDLWIVQTHHGKRV